MIFHKKVHFIYRRQLLGLEDELFLRTLVMTIQFLTKKVYTNYRKNPIFQLYAFLQS